MAIQMRRGLKVNFDPQKMLPGEWAVSTDTETENQIIWMCFRAGVVKRMGTYEDFREQIMEIADEIAEEFSQTFNEIKVYMEGLRDTTKMYMDTTKGYKDTSAQKATEASDSATQASVSATNSANSADLSEDYSKQAKSYAKGTGGEVRPNDDSDCAEFYYEQTKRISQGIEGIIPMGTITFAELSLPYNEIPKYMFDISDDFVTDERFKNGSGVYYGAGSNVIRTADDMWDVLAPVSVSGVKGDKEATYRQGFVNLTPADIGAATIEDLVGVNADFIGTKEELDAMIASGEISDGTTVFLKDVNGNGEGDGTGGIAGELTPDKVLVSDSDGNITSSLVTSSELECLSGAKSNLQQQIDNISQGGGGGEIGNLEPNKAVVSDDGGSLASSLVTATELECLSGIESNVQEQIETLGMDLQMKINEMMQKFFVQAVYIGQCAWSLGEILKWGMEYESLEGNGGSIGSMAIYRPWTNTWEEKYNSYNYKGSIKSNDWLTGNLEVATLRPKSVLDISYKNQSLREERVVFTPFDWLKQWFPVSIESNLIFSPFENILTVAFTYKEYYKESGIVKSPWGKAFVNMYDAQSLDKTPSGNALVTMGMYVNFGRDIKTYWNNLSSANFEYKEWFLFFRVIMIDWAKLFPKTFLDDTKNGYIEKYGRKIGVIYGNNLNWDHIPVDNQIKGFGEE